MCCPMLKVQKICIVMSILTNIVDCIVFALLSPIFGIMLIVLDAAVFCLTLVSIIIVHRFYITLSLLCNTILRIPVIMALTMTVTNLFVAEDVLYLTIISSSLAIIFYVCLCVGLQKLRRVSSTDIRVTIRTIPQLEVASVTTSIPFSITSAEPPPAYSSVSGQPLHVSSSVSTIMK
ncbi:unnamed protein product [Cylicocyclus nassatus]|uniref:Uncharacterized protein n=1 Tax=Cylicocyclus nassatus TaxID=53992 RepID=A0AA36GIP4_CYLNA|nr:unnamed protein product [Cylicocyclus nassatus]